MDKNDLVEIIQSEIGISLSDSSKYLKNSKILFSLKCKR